MFCVVSCYLGVVGHTWVCLGMFGHACVFGHGFMWFRVFRGVLRGFVGFCFVKSFHTTCVKNKISLI